MRFTSHPGELFERIGKKKGTTIFIDEVQRMPSILNSAQTLIDDRKRSLRFFLTGSSARKLRRGQANLLPGRVISLRFRTYQNPSLTPSLVLVDPLEDFSLSHFHEN